MQLRMLAFIGSLIACTYIGASTINNFMNQEQKCDDVLRFGRWTIQHQAGFDHRQWQPYGSLLHEYDHASTQKCLQTHKLTFIGDSTARQLFWATAVKLAGEEAEAVKGKVGKHEDIHNTAHNATLSFYWDPYLNRSETLEILNYEHQPGRESAVILSTGLWQARHAGENFIQDFTQNLGRIVQILNAPGQQAVPFPLVMAIPPPYLNYSQLNPERAATLTPQRVAALAEYLEEIELTSTIKPLWAARQMTYANPMAMENEGLHVTKDIASIQRDLVLNRVCNDKLFRHTQPANALACVDTQNSKLTLVAGLFVMVLILSSHSLQGAYERFKNVLDDPRWATPSLVSIIWYCWVADRTTLLETSSKIFSEYLFMIVALVVILPCLFFCDIIGKSSHVQLPQAKGQVIIVPANHGLLPREVTEEWKGWMQILILLYHYFGMSKVLWVYKIVRVLVGAYLFLTGYGHTMHFQTAGDMSFARVVKVLMRLNVLTCVLVVVMTNTYDFYYFPGLASLWFLITYATFWRPKGWRVSLSEAFLRIGISAWVMRMLLRSDRLLVKAFHTLVSLHGPKINPHEFVFRTSLDMFAPYLGMVVAILEVRHWEEACSFLRSYSSAVKRWFSIGIIVTAMCMLSLYHCLASQYKDKYSYNEWHSSLSMLPIIAYILLRNASQTIRFYYSRPLASIGSMSLELFILQYHTWLAADTKGLLRPGLLDSPRFASGKSMADSWTFWLETVMVTVVFFWNSYTCAQATNALVNSFVSKGIPAKSRSRKTFVLGGRIAVCLLVLWMCNRLPTAF